jgi:peptidyl-prolyl cis-trans isomerase C
MTKILTTPLLFSALLYGQAAAQSQPPVTITPGAPAVQAPAGTIPAVPSGAAAATPAPPLSPDTVVVEVNGKKYTKAEVDKLIAILPAQFQSMVRAKPEALGQVFLMQRLAEDAQKAGLDQKEPYKEQLEVQRMQLLGTAELTEINNTMTVTEEDEQKYYKDNLDKFKEVKVRVIHIGFTPALPKAPPAQQAEPAGEGTKPLTEAEARAKIEDVAKQIQGGADFGKLAHDVSDDHASAAKDGDFGVIKQDSAYPPAIKNAVFALKQGEVSMPIRQPNGFYLIRAEEIKQSSFSDAFQQISQATRKAKYEEWLKGLQSQYNVKIENPAYFSGSRTMPTRLQQTH